MWTLPSYLWPPDGWTRRYKGLDTEPLWQAHPRGPRHRPTDTRAPRLVPACQPTALLHHGFVPVLELPRCMASPWNRQEADWNSLDTNHPLWPAWDVLIWDNVWFSDMCDPSFKCCVKGNYKINCVICAALKVLSSLFHRPADPYFLTYSCQCYVDKIQCFMILWPWSQI